MKHTTFSFLKLNNQHRNLVTSIPPCSCHTFQNFEKKPWLDVGDRQIFLDVRSFLLVTIKRSECRKHFKNILSPKNTFHNFKTKQMTINTLKAQIFFVNHCEREPNRRANADGMSGFKKNYSLPHTHTQKGIFYFFQITKSTERGGRRENKKKRYRSRGWICGK